MSISGAGLRLHRSVAVNLLWALLFLWDLGPRVLRSWVPDAMRRPLEIVFVILTVLVMWGASAEIARRARAAR